ncbi:MAG: hypothetical protein BWK80_30365 [Desulfobacteraceae bacterium IS3]|nr:MAG: hypothetical protein BWK80_30365 [Desulfobacteraceae bacterium IS3]
MFEEKDDFNDCAVEEFRQSIQKLYTEVKNWLRGMVFKEVSVDIYEEYAVPYKIAELYIYKEDAFLCKIKPAGAHIIAADGRADLVGKRDKLVFVFFKELSANTESHNTGTDRHTLYEGYEGAGWYVSWGKRKISLLSEGIFLKATEEVSGYKHL